MSYDRRSRVKIVRATLDELESKINKAIADLGDPYIVCVNLYDFPLAPSMTVAEAELLGEPVQYYTTVEKLCLALILYNEKVEEIKKFGSKYRKS